jgi:hypothetical protein
VNGSFEDSDVVAVPGQQRRREQAPDRAADHADLELVGHLRFPCLGACPDASGRPHTAGPTVVEFSINISPTALSNPNIDKRGTVVVERVGKADAELFEDTDTSTEYSPPFGSCRQV